METTVTIKSLNLDGKNYWQLLDLPHVIISAENQNELKEKLNQILPEYFQQFPSEVARVLEAPEMLRIPVEV